MTSTLTARNLFPYSSVEATSGTVELRRNLATNPLGSATDAANGTLGFVATWFGAGSSSGTTTTATVVGPAGTGITQAMRKTWTALGTAAQDIGAYHTQPTAANAYPVTPGQVLTVSSYLQHSWDDTTATGWHDYLLVQVFDSAGTQIGATLQGTPAVKGAANTWVRAWGTFTMPAGAAHAVIRREYYTDVSLLSVGATLDSTGLLVENGSVLGNYIDGNMAAAGDFTYAWLGTANASQSVMRAVAVTGITPYSTTWGYSSTKWSAEGTRSLAIQVPMVAPVVATDTTVDIGLGSILQSQITAGKLVWTFVAKFQQDAAQTGTLSAWARRLRVSMTTGTVAYSAETVPTNTSGMQEYRVTLTFSAGASVASTYLYNGSATGGETVRWDLATLVEGVYAGPPFSGSTPYDGGYYVWDGTTDASTASRLLITLPDLPPGLVPLHTLGTSDILAGARVTSYRFELLTHNPTTGIDSYAGLLDGVTLNGTLNWDSTTPVQKSGTLEVVDLATAQAGMIRIADVNRVTARIRPVLQIQGLPDVPLGVYVITAAPESFSGTGRTYALELHDKSIRLEEATTTTTTNMAAGTVILPAIKQVIADAHETINIDATETRTLSIPFGWAAGTSRLTIVNDLLAALNYNPLWMDGQGNLRATPWVKPANRPRVYEVLNLPRELLYGPTAIYQPTFRRDRDYYKVPNQVIAIEASGTTAPPIIVTSTNSNPASDLSTVKRGYTLAVTLPPVQVPAGTVTDRTAFIQATADQQLIVKSAVFDALDLSVLPVPTELLDAFRFQYTPAGIDASYTVLRAAWQLKPGGLLMLSFQSTANL